MGTGDYAALCSLPEHLGEAQHGNGAGRDNVGHDLSWPNRRKLVKVAHDQQGGLVRHRFHECLHQHDIDHGRPVDHQQIAVEQVVIALPHVKFFFAKTPSAERLPLSGAETVFGQVFWEWGMSNFQKSNSLPYRRGLI